MYDAILALTDGSRTAAAALDHAIALAERFDATVSLLAVVDPSRNPMAFGVREVAEIDRVADRVVADLIAAYDDHEVELRGDVRRGRPIEEVLAYAAAIDADLIVVGRSDAEEVATTALDRAADRLVRSASVPVTVVPEPVDGGAVE